MSFFTKRFSSSSLKIKGLKPKGLLLLAFPFLNLIKLLYNYAIKCH